MNISYELGVSPVISMRTHLAIDLASGIILAASPWIFGFADYVWAPHLVLGVLEIGASAFTKTEPQAERRSHGHRPAAVH